MLALSLALAVGLMSAPATLSSAAPVPAQAAADRADLDAALARLAAARARSDELSARLTQATARADGLIADEQALQQAIDLRADAIYRSGFDDVIYVLLSSRSLQELEWTMDVFARLAAQDTERLAALEASRIRALRTARSLIGLQVRAAQAADAVTAEVAAARTRFAASAAALREYDARVAASAPPRAPALPRPPQRTGTGAWSVGVASHYSPNFHGHGASGAAITPYSMMCAHRTLPFHTLIEFEYNGRRCVASVEDRGPFSHGRDFDLGPGVVRALGFAGVHPIRYRIIGQ